VGINTYFDPPTGSNFHASYEIETSAASTRFWLRRQVHTTMDVEVSIDGRRIGFIPAGVATPADAMDLGVWNAGTGESTLKVGWYSIAFASPLAKGAHRVMIVALPARASRRAALDTKLLGGQAEQQATKGAFARMLHTLQIDVFMLSNYPAP
jgi:hypothetical protein